MSAPNDLTLKQLYRNFISGCHILHYHQVLDAYGHLSARHPSKPDVFIMSRYIAPGTISSERDLVEYYVADATPVDHNSPKGYSERCIHSEVYKQYPDVHSVIHSHSEAVVPYSISGVPFQACFHMAGFLGTHTPVFDVSKYYRPDDAQDMLVRNTHLGEALASYFSESKDGRTADHAVVLMRGHGLTVIAPSIEDCVLRSVYTQQNARIQTTALITRAAHVGASGPQAQVAEMGYLNATEAAASADMTQWSAMRPWKLWVRELEAAGLYVNFA